jgi:hypothetical protein
MRRSGYPTRRHGFMSRLGSGPEMCSNGFADQDFIKSIRDYRVKTEGLFHEVEAVRMPLAKHEIACTGKEKLLAGRCGAADHDPARVADGAGG